MGTDTSDNPAPSILPLFYPEDGSNRPSKIVVPIYQSTPQHNPEDFKSCENLTFHTF